MINNLPNDWKVEELGNCVDILDNQRIPLNNQDREERIKGKNISELFPYYGATQQVGYIDDFLFDEELVLLGEDGVMFYDKDKQKAYLINGKSWVNNHAHVLRAKKNITINKYLVNFLNTFHYKGFVSGATRLKLNQSRMAKIPIPIPPLEQQKKIVKVLDLTSNLIEKQKELLEKYDLFLKSKFIEMFGCPVQNEKQWITKTIEEIVKKEKHSIKRGPFGGALKKEIFVPKGYLVYEQFHALNNDFTMERYFIDEEKFNELNSFEVKSGDIIISCSGVYLGKLAIVPKNSKKGIINQALLKISLDNEKMNNILFTYIFTNKNFKQKFFGNFIGSGIPNFPPMSDFKKFTFIFPPIELQNKFASIVEKIETIKEKENQKLQQLENLHNSMMNKAFKGEIK